MMPDDDYVLRFDIYPSESTSVPESISDFLGNPQVDFLWTPIELPIPESISDSPEMDVADVVGVSNMPDTVNAPRVSNWDDESEDVVVKKCIPRGICDHKKPRSFCWKCNPCKICPKIRWGGDKFRPYPRSLPHLRSTIHEESVAKRNMRNDKARSSQTTTTIPDVPPRLKKSMQCGHGGSWTYCRFCNACSICNKSGVGVYLANTRDHRKSPMHVMNVMHYIGMSGLGDAD